MSFADLKKKSSLEIITKKLEQKNTSYKDDRFWEPTQDSKTGLGSATIRFLPTAADNDAPWVNTFGHGFQNADTGKWFVETCPRTTGGECPICSAIQPLWKGSDADKKIASARKAKKYWISNILVVSDPANPENDGKVFLFRYGKQIFDKILAMVKPEFETDNPVNVFDFWSGADFQLRITKNQGGFKTYEKSAFKSPSELYGGDDTKLETLWNSQYDLREFVDPAKVQIKSAEDLMKRYNEVVSGVAGSATSAANKILDELDQAKSEPKFAKKSEELPWDGEEQEAKPEKKAESKPAAKADDGEDEWMELLKDL